MTLSRDQFPLKYMYSQERSHNSPFRVRYGLSVVNSNTNLYPASVTAVLQAISCHSGHVIMALSNIMCTQMTIPSRDLIVQASRVKYRVTYDIDGLDQDSCISSALAMELPQSSA